MIVERLQAYLRLELFVFEDTTNARQTSTTQASNNTANTTGSTGSTATTNDISDTSTTDGINNGVALTDTNTLDETKDIEADTDKENLETNEDSAEQEESDTDKEESDEVIEANIMGAALRQNRGGEPTVIDLATTNWVNKIEVGKLNTATGKWEKATTFNNGDTVRIQLSYSIPANELDSYNTKLTYKIPDGVSLENSQQGPVYSPEGVQIGDYTISTDGEVSILFNDKFDITIAEIGTVNLQGMLLNESTTEDKTITFPQGDTSTTITIKKKEEAVTPPTDDSDISVSKAVGEVSADKSSVEYTVKVSTSKGTSSTVNVIDAFTWGQNTIASYDASSFVIERVNKYDEVQETLTGSYTPNISVNAIGYETFTISGLP